MLGDYKQDIVYDHGVNWMKYTSPINPGLAGHKHRGNEMNLSRILGLMKQCRRFNLDI